MEERIAQLVAQLYANKAMRNLNRQEKELTQLLLKAGYLKSPSSDFLGPLADKGRDPVRTPIKVSAKL